MPYTNLLFNIRNGVAVITLNRPASNNALDLGMARELKDAADRCSRDSTIGAVLLTAEGTTFCPGGDMKAFAQEGDDLPLYLQHATFHLHAAMSTFVQMPAPLVVAVNGTAAGVGMSLALAGDITLAGESSRFVMAYTQQGLTPDGGATYFLARSVGLKRALELVLTNRILSAQEALAWGIVTRVVSDGDLLSEAEAVASQLAVGKTKALAASKRLLHGACTNVLEIQMEQESRTICEMGGTAETKGAIASFVNKRKSKKRV